jgi:hypothetical protein
MHKETRTLCLFEAAIEVGGESVGIRNGALTVRECTVRVERSAGLMGRLANAAIETPTPPTPIPRPRRRPRPRPRGATGLGFRPPTRLRPRPRQSSTTTTTPTPTLRLRRVSRGAGGASLRSDALHYGPSDALSTVDHAAAEPRTHRPASSRLHPFEELVYPKAGVPSACSSRRCGHLDFPRGVPRW